MVEVSVMPSKRSELANILRCLADYIDNHPDEDLAPIFRQAAALTQSTERQKKSPPPKGAPLNIGAIVAQLQMLKSRDEGDALLRASASNRSGLETIARFLQLPVQRDDTVDKLRAKIVENTIGSRLRSEAIQGKDK